MSVSPKARSAYIPVLVAVLLIAGCTPRANGPLNRTETDSGNQSEICQPTVGAVTAYLALPIEVDESKAIEIETVTLVSAKNVTLVESRLVPVSPDSQFILELAPLRPKAAQAWNAGGLAVGADVASGEAVELMSQVDIPEPGNEASTAGFEIIYHSDGDAYRYQSTVTYRLKPGTC